MAQSFDELLKAGIEAARAGDRNQARMLLAQAIKANPQSEAAWLWMSGVLEKPEDRIRSLQQVLNINPQNEMAIKGLQALNVDVAPVSPPPAEPEYIEPEPEPLGVPQADLRAPIDEPTVEAGIPEPTFDGSGVPIPNPAAIQQAVQQVKPIVDELVSQTGSRLQVEWAAPLLPENASPLPIPSVEEETAASSSTKAKKSRRVQLPNIRFDPRSVNPIVYYVIGGVIGLVILGGLIITVINNTREARIAANATPTPSPTPVESPTPTVTAQPSRTPTPEGRPITPEPTILPEGAPRGNLAFMATPTEPYVATPHRGTVLGEAQTAFYLDDYESTIELVMEAIEEGETSPDAYYYLGLAQFNLNDFDAARETLEQGIATDGNFAPNYAALGVVLEAEGSPERAQVASLDAKRIDPELLTPYLTLARLYADNSTLTRPADETENDELDGFDAAFTEVGAALDADSNFQFDVNLLALQSELLRRDGELDDSLAVANLAVYVDPAAEGAVLAANRTRLDLEYYDSIIISLERYLDEVNPSSSDAWGLLAEAYRSTGRSEDALMAYGRVEQLTDDPQLLLGRGLLLYEEGNYEAAYEALSRLDDFDPSQRDVLLSRALSAIEIGEAEQALDDLTLVREELGDDFDLELDVVYIQVLVEVGQTEEAIFEATRFLGLQNIEPELRAQAFEARATAHLEEGNGSFAFNDATAALNISENVTRYYLQARALELTLQPTQAQRVYEYVVYWGTILGNPVTEDAAERLDALQN